ncbi:Putative gamma-glutamyltransferase YwrD [Fuerstiella marisgermanici]|uniref:Glutathione hydrolase proenzyme n=2 Tax=Fuerstiella marisgermanici TaxID=1891926 RepID=A0A1P8WMB2_9PLAN|nr:gamma-glutamyltransferase [Fuerstiella marisgermanici]APZ95203.1 Putative gamma-glutamyltransferase YwrD [Fuerstiella marisgermanici]
MKQLLHLLAAVSLLVHSCHAGDRPTGRKFATRSEVIARHGMAATSQPLATQVALDILKQGGSAVDAAIAANATLGLMEPTGNGIGGDLFAIVWDSKTQKLHGLNASGRSPASLTLEEFRKRDLESIPPFGPLPVTVPGCVDGWFALHGKFGKLPMKDVLAPAIRYCEEGFPVSEVIAAGWRGSRNTLSKYPGFLETYFPNGKGPATGDIFRNPMLAATLKQIAVGGRDAFYKGEIAHTIADFMQKHGGFLSYEDLASHRSEWVEPVSANYRGYDVWELPPNGQGIAALQILNVLEGYDLKTAGFGSADHLHWFVEAKKLAFEDRARLYADMDFAKVPVQKLISKEYANERRKLINSNKAAAEYSVGLPHALEEGDTIYLTVADKDHNMVSLIQSNYRGFGSGMCPDGLGFCLQDRGQLFDLAEGRFNTYAPGKRPFHTIIPAFVTKDGKPFMSFGVMGGATQPQAHVQIIVNMIDFGMNTQEAGDAPRILHQGSSQPTGDQMTDGGTVALESGFGKKPREALKARGHKLKPAPGSFGGYQAIRYDADRDVYFGASESRKDGHAAGY